MAGLFILIAGVQWTSAQIPGVSARFPSLSKYPESDFGFAYVGVPYDLEGTITNLGWPTKLVIGSFSISGANAAEFHPPNVTNFEVYLRTEASVLFQAVSPGQKNATLQIHSNDPNSPTLVPLTIRAVTAPRISISPGELVFGHVAVGSASPPQTITVWNNTAEAVLAGFYHDPGSGDYYKHFTIKGGDLRLWNSPFPSLESMDAHRIPPGGKRTLQYVFKPDSPGEKNAAVDIHFTGVTQNPLFIGSPGGVMTDPYSPVAVTLVGNRADPEIVVEQPAGSRLVDGKTRKSFGTVTVGKSGQAKTFTIKNTGKAKLRDLAISKSGTHKNNFSVTGPTRTTLAAGASTTFKVTFKPRAKGARKAAIHIKSNDANENPFDIKLTGMGATR